MSMLYVVAAMVVVPALLGAFHLLSRPPQVTSQPRPVTPAPPPDDVTVVDGDRLEAVEWGRVADEAERWLRSQRSS